jgi:hypothetical protein
VTVSDLQNSVSHAAVKSATLQIPPAATSNGIPARAGYSIPEAGVLLGGASAATIYRWANRGIIRLVKIGSRTIVPASEIARLTAGQSAA